MKNYLKEVTSVYLAIKPKCSQEMMLYLKEQMYVTKYKVHKLELKDHRKLLKYPFSFTELPIKEQDKIWSYIFKNTEYLDIGSLAVDYFKQYQKQKSFSMINLWGELKTWIPYIENWIHGDMLCSMFKDMLNENKKLIYPELKKLSQANSHWKKRIAIVSSVYHFHPAREIPSFNQVKTLFHPHLNIDHYYLQKSIGWTLRELSRAYPKEFEDYMNKNVTSLSPTAYSTAVEKVTKKKKDKYRKIRKEARGKN